MAATTRRSASLQSIYNIPFYLAGTVFVDVTGVTAGKPDSIPKAAVALGQSLIGAWIIWLIFNLSLNVTGDESAAALASLTAAFGTVLWPYAKFGFNQPLACATLAAAVSGVYVGVRQRKPSRYGLRRRVARRQPVDTARDGDRRVASRRCGWCLPRVTPATASGSLWRSCRACWPVSPCGWRSTWFASATRSKRDISATRRRGSAARSCKDSPACCSVPAPHCSCTHRLHSWALLASFGSGSAID